jgi:hypothetical protein
MKKVTNPIWLIISAVILCTGCFLPWAAEVDGLGEANGMDGDGQLLIVFGVILIVIGFLLVAEKVKRKAHFAAFILSGLSLLISIYDMNNIGSAEGATVNISNGEGATINIGSVGGTTIEYGIVICLIGAALAFVFSVRGVFTKAKETEIDHGNKHSTPKMTNKTETTEGE